MTGKRVPNAGVVVGLGLDIVEVDRVTAALVRHGDRFVVRICAETERREWALEPDGARSLAVRFAVKEACLKALGTGWADGLAFHQIEVGLQAGPVPTIRLRGPAGERARRRGVSTAMASVTEAGGTVAALVVLA